MNANLKILIALAAGFGAGALSFYLVGDGDAAPTAGAYSPAEPLYWVAPMDPNFRRDGPGKSPMGMDLVPVYADDLGAGTIRVDPNVQHSMGVRTATVRRGVLESPIVTTATVMLSEDRMTVVSPRIEGWLEKLHVRSRHESVSAGQPLFEIYSPALVNAQEEYVAALGSGNRLLIDSARERLRSLSVPEAMLERLETSRSVSRTVTFPATHAGIVESLNVREGMYVSPGTPVMTVASLEEVWVEAEIFESDIASVAEGNEMEVRLARGEVLLASIDYVHPVLESDTRTLQLRAVVPNPNGTLKPNMFAEARIKPERGEVRTLVPTSALIRLGDQDRVVLAIDDETFKSVAVTVGQVGTNEAEVISGLEPGDRVVTAAQFLLDSESSKTSDFSRMMLASAEGMDHSKMGHGQMDHSKMGHGQMDHSEMEHAGGAMEHGGEAMEHAGHEMEHAGEAMDHSGMDHSGMDHSADGEGRMVWVNATIRSVNPDNRMLNLTHEPIPEWQWPVMTMMMNAGPGVDLEAISRGDQVRIHIREAPDADTGYVVMHVEPADGTP